MAQALTRVYSTVDGALQRTLAPLLPAVTWIAGPWEVDAEVWLLDGREDPSATALRVGTMRVLGHMLPVVVLASGDMPELEALGADVRVLSATGADVPALAEAIQQACALASFGPADWLGSALFDASSSACLVLDARGRVEHANARARAWSAAKGAELVPGADFLGCARAWFGDAAAPIRPAWAEARQGRGVSVHFDADQIPYHARLEPLGDRGRVVVSARDVSRRKQAEARLRHEVTHDRLTGLPNRAGLVQALGERLQAHAVDVLVVDIDRFETVNDSLGLVLGDRLLEAFGARLRALLPETGIAARLSGDEFALLPPLGEDPHGLAEAVCAMARKPFLIDDLEVFVSASVGVVTATRATSSDDVLRAASLAVYAAKEGGGDRAVFHEDAMEGRAHERLLLETDVREALASDAFTLAFQPIVNLSDRSCVGVEALLRWTHPTRGEVLPEVYLPLCEELGWMPDITARVLRRALAAFGRARARFPELARARVHVNVAASDLQRSSLVEEVAEALRRADLPGTALCVEFSESAVMHGPSAAVRTLEGLRAIGVATAIDDFGTGYSSLAWLSRLPIDAVKVDGAFMRATPETGLSIVRTILTVAETLGLDVIAEGVETDEQRLWVQDTGCIRAQGYAFAAPVPEDGLASALRS